MVQVIKAVREAVHEAVVALVDAKEKCLIAGHRLNEARAVLTRRHGTNGRFESWDPGDGFMEWVKKNIPEICHDTANKWMKAASNICLALGKGDGSRMQLGDQVIDIESIPVSEILTRPVDELPETARQWRQSWFDFTADKSIKACLEGVFLDGDETGNLARVVAGKTRPGAGGGGRYDDRKDYPDFTLRKLKHINTFFGFWDTMTERQRTEIKDEFSAAILGEEYKLRGRAGDECRAPVVFGAWPAELCEVVLEALKARLKNREARETR